MRARGSTGNRLALREFRDRGLCAPSRQGAEGIVGLVSEHDVLGDRERADQHEMLVHHAEPELDRVRGRGDLRCSVVDLDRAPIGREQPVEHTHERALPRAIFADQRVCFARNEIERDIVIGNEAAEFFGDVAQRNRGRGMAG
jgi:hypothetical protein